MKSNIENFENYLSKLSFETNVSNEFANNIRSLWFNICNVVGKPLKPPVAGPGGELGFLFSWSTKDYSIIIDINFEGNFEWFFRDRINKIHAGSDGACLRIPDELVQLLNKYCLI